MIKISVALLSVFLLVSCNTDSKQATQKSTGTQESAQKEAPAQGSFPNEKFQGLNFIELNEKVAGKSSMTPEDIMRTYYPYQVDTNSEGNESIRITTKQIDPSSTEVVLIHDNRMDDSVRGEKYVMMLAKSGASWTVVSLKKNWKCWSGRGHTDWGIEPCT